MARKGDATLGESRSTGRATNSDTTETPVEAQRQFARENNGIADRLDAAGHRDLAAVYRDTAREHADCAERIRAGCDTVTHSEGTKPHGVIPTWN